MYLVYHGWLQDLSTVFVACEGRCVARFVCVWGLKIGYVHL